jgi:hypothetical protein
MEINYINVDELSRGRHEARILRVKSPLLFWIRLKTGEKTLRNLLRELTIYMGQEGKNWIMWPSEITQDQTVAVQHKDDWQRGVITRVNQSRGRALIALADWGLTIWKSYGQLFQLEKRFKELPWQAIACGLAHVAPPAPTSTWSLKTRALCRALAEEEDGWVRFKYPLGAGAALVDITILGPSDGSIFNNMIHLREALIRLGHVRAEKKITVDTFPAV